MAIASGQQLDNVHMKSLRVFSRNTIQTLRKRKRSICERHTVNQGYLLLWPVYSWQQERLLQPLEMPMPASASIHVRLRISLTFQRSCYQGQLATGISIITISEVASEPL